MATDDVRYKTLKDFGRILSLFESTQGEERGVSDISKSLQMLPSKVSRMMKTLEGEGFFEKNPESGRYRTGGRFLQVGLLYVLNHPLRRIILPHLEQMHRDLDRLTSWGIFRNERIIVVDRIGVREVVLMHPLGSGPPMHSSSYGKVFLAYRPQEEQERVLRSIDYVSFTAATICTPGGMREELRLVKERGYAVDKGETREDISAITAPVLNGQRELVAAITVGIKTVLLTPDRVVELAGYLTGKARFISRQLGYVPGLPA
jgi:IclR family transcriptional regulator, acetate operon repressor